MELPGRQQGSQQKTQKQQDQDLEDLQNRGGYSGPGSCFCGLCAFLVDFVLNSVLDFRNQKFVDFNSKGLLCGHFGYFKDFLNLDYYSGVSHFGKL